MKEKTAGADQKRQALEPLRRLIPPCAARLFVRIHAAPDKISAQIIS